MFELLLINAAPEAGILAFEDFHTYGCMASKEDCHTYMEAYRTCLCHSYRS